MPLPDFPFRPSRRFGRAPQAATSTWLVLLTSTLFGVSACSSGDGLSAGDAADAAAGDDVGVADATAPRVVDLTLRETASGQVTIAWQTDEAATSYVEIGQSLDYGVHVEVALAPATDHEATIDGLHEETEYHFRLVCSDELGNTTVGEDETFRVSDTTGPQINQIEILTAGADSLAVRWQTDEPATSLVAFGHSPSVAQLTGTAGSVEQFVNEHEVLLTGLEPGRWYVRVSSSDEHGNATSSSVRSADLADQVAPAILALVAEPLYPTAVRLAWTTDELATARVEYGYDLVLGSSVGTSGYAEVHSLEVPDVEPGATLHYRVVASDEYGNEGVSAVHSFTLADKMPPVVSDVSLVPSGDSISIGWSTDEPALARIEWGVTTEYSNTVGSSDFGMDHAFVISDLAPGIYHFRILAEDPDGNLTVGPDQTFDVLDQVPPTIDNVNAVSLLPGHAIVVWDTNEPASSTVQYGPTPSMGQFAFGAADLVEHHAVILSGFNIGTTYYYQVSSTDAKGNIGTNGGHAFVAQDYFPPVISNVAVTQLGQHAATVTWQTDEPAIYLVQYGETLAFGQSIFEASQFATNHSVVINGVDVGEWFVQVICADAQGNLAVAPNVSLQVHDVTAPVLGPITVIEDWNEAVLTWQTDEPALSRVDFGTSAAYGATLFGTGGVKTDHIVRIPGLTAETIYHYSVTCSDGSGNESSTPDSTFETEEEPSPVVIDGRMVAWYPLELSVPGPIAHELDTNPHPFLDYRFNVRFTSPSGIKWVVPGFFDGDGEGGSSGDTWRARFAPGEPGTWDYELLFHEGNDLAVNANMSAGSPIAPNGTTGNFDIDPVDPNAPGFYKWGLLEYVGEPYLKFRDGPWFLKGGTNSPENLLAYRGFDNTFDQGGLDIGLPNQVHRFEEHKSDFVSGDPWFVSDDHDYNSKGIIGAINYLASMNVNSVYFLAMNLGGDGREVCPFVGYSGSSFDDTHYDISKLKQWNELFEHVTAAGMQLHVVLNETEQDNEDWLSGGTLGKERKLFYRELIARFGHHLAIKWNLSEENDFSQSELEAFADYIDEQDAYDHPIAFHTHMLSGSGYYEDYEDVLGDSRFSSTSIQCMPDSVGEIVERWREDSESADQPWVVEIDEIGPAGTGLTQDNASELRKKCLWDIYLSGGHVEWYFGFHGAGVGGDLNVEDFRSREDMWNYMWFARKFLEDLPFHEMVSRDELVSGEGQNNGGAEVFAKRNEVYAIYFPDTSSTGTINLTETPQVTYAKRWYNPRTGNFSGGTTQVEGNEVLSNGSPPSSGSSTDWVLLYERL